jgi:glycerol-3-phosphate dehydrogenase
MKTFSFHDRKKIIERMAADLFDVVIIGGGITGAGVARDAAMRGMSVALVEGSDFASGTSSRSSKLIHGGIRYLENMEFKLVYEALSERQKLFEMAPHLVHPLRFMLPLYRGGRVGMAKMGLGMWVYDALSLFQAPELHEKLTSQECLDRVPSLQVQDLLGSYVYSDAYMDDDRLVHETLRSAVANGAVCASYIKAVGCEYDTAGKAQAIHCLDSVDGKKIKIRGRHIISTVGPWTDELGPKLVHQWKNILRPTKGIHLTFEKQRLPLPSAVVMAAEERIVFAIPRHEMVIVGTTDTDFQGDPENVTANVDEVKYILGVLDRYFPGAKITAHDVVGSYAGVRPLVYDGSQSEGKTSREHVIHTTSEGITFVAGGKYTTYRLIAEQVVDESLQYFAIEDRVKWTRCETDSPLNPLVTQESQERKEMFAEQIIHETSWTNKEAATFFDRHGVEALNIIEKYGRDKSPVELEAYHAINETMCFHLVDFFARRVPLFLAERDHGISQLHKIIPVFSECLFWNDHTILQEKKSLDQYAARELSWAGALKSL